MSATCPTPASTMRAQPGSSSRRASETEEVAARALGRRKRIPEPSGDLPTVPRTAESRGHTRAVPFWNRNAEPPGIPTHKKLFRFPGFDLCPCFSQKSHSWGAWGLSQ